jgi:transposase
VIPSQSPLRGGRQEVFDWMRAVLQRALSRSDLARELGQVTELDELLTAVWEGKLSHRNRAMTILARERGIGQSHACSFLHISKGTATRYWNHYQQGGQAKLLAPRERSRKSKNDGIKQAVFGLLHTPPSAHGINRSTWRLTDLQKVLRSQRQPLCRDVIRTIIQRAGYKWRKARIVLTSQDPEYRVKIEAIKKILSELKKDEAFFSIDEFGPFAVKKRCGRKRVGPEESYTVPQWQKSKGYLIITAALELSRNQVTHFYSKKKNTQEMIKMMDLLRTQYRGCKTIYLSWDAASWHISKELFSQITDRNDEDPARGYPVVKTAPLPAGAQFLNVIESVFSGMARAIIHNSDYHSLDAAKAAIDKHFGDLGRYPDELVVAMNRAAESAVPEARALLVDAISQMSVDDGKEVIRGGAESATRYFRRQTEAAMAARFLPVVQAATRRLQVADPYNQAAGRAAKVGLLRLEDSNLDEYVTRKALDGVYSAMAEEERAIRAHPMQQTQKTLRKVFGAL